MHGCKLWRLRCCPAARNRGRNVTRYISRRRPCVAERRLPQGRLRLRGKRGGKLGGDAISRFPGLRGHDDGGWVVRRHTGVPQGHGLARLMHILWGSPLRRAMTVGVCSTLVMIAFTLVTASTSGLTLAAVLVIIGFWVLTG